jgi:hypothetical protein
MKKIYILFISVFLFVGCSKETESEGIKNVDLEFTQFDVTLSSGVESIGVIDDVNNHISLSGIVDPINIKSVTYKYSDDVSLVTPNPSTRIGSWTINETFRLHSGSSFEDYTVEITDFEEPVFENQATIAPLETFGTYIKYHMLDLNGDATKASNVATANIAFGEKGMNGIRFPLYCGDAYGGHPEEGVVIESVYERPLISLTNAKAAYSGSEPFIIFLGIKVLTSNKDEIYPDWVTTEDSDVANPDKYAQLIVDFITFMGQKGHTIDAVAIDKETVRMSVDNFKISVDSLRAKTARLGYVVPKIVAPELLDPQGDTNNGWMNELYDKGYQDRYDVFGNHYYQRDHNEEGFAKYKYEFELSQKDKTRPAWATEPHWNGDGDLFSSESALGIMMDHADLGMEAFMWWDYPISGGTKFRHSVMRAFSDAIHRSTPIRMIDHDGENILSQGKLHTRAYLKGDEVNVFLLNVINPNTADLVPVSYEDYVIGILDSFKVDGDVTVRQWRESTDNDTDIEGEYTVINPTGDNQILLDLPTGSVTHLTFKITQ